MLFDGGVSVGALDKKVWEANKEALGPGKPSTTILRMASGQLILSERRWEGTVEIEGISKWVRLEVFDSGGGWQVLLGKPLQAALGAIHDYAADIIRIQTGDTAVELKNEKTTKKKKSKRVPKQRGVFQGILSFPKDTAKRGVEEEQASNTSKLTPEAGEWDEEAQVSEDDDEAGEDGRNEESEPQGGQEGRTAGELAVEAMRALEMDEKGIQKRANEEGVSAAPLREVQLTSDVYAIPNTDTNAKLPNTPNEPTKPNVYTRKTDPFNPARVE
ncbi:hypothetical protein C8F01DRAFT_1165177 [Mycena amicta]|nr:hypothetical protein C8F01DRAFT_1165177 [Mycena amicta]